MGRTAMCYNCKKITHLREDGSYSCPRCKAWQSKEDIDAHNLEVKNKKELVKQKRQLQDMDIIRQAMLKISTMQKKIKMEKKLKAKIHAMIACYIGGGDCRPYIHLAKKILKGEQA